MTFDLDALIAKIPLRRVRIVAELTRRTIRDAIDDRVTGLAAEIAFWVLLSLPPLLLVVVSAAGFVGEAVGADVRADLIARLSTAADAVFDESTVEETIQPVLDELLGRGSTSLLSLGFLITIYSASRALRVVLHALAIAYDLEDERASWKARVLGFLYVLAAIPIVGVIVPLVLAGPGLGAQLEELLPVARGLDTVWRTVYWPGALMLLTGLLTLLYHRGAPWWTPYRRDLPGALLATILGLLASLGLRAYTTRAFGSDAIYASLAAPLAVLVWLWLQGIALLLGAELNAEIERMWPLREPTDEEGRPLRRLSSRAVDAARDAVRGRGNADTPEREEQP